MMGIHTYTYYMQLLMFMPLFNVHYCSHYTLNKQQNHSFNLTATFAKTISTIVTYNIYEQCAFIWKKGFPCPWLESNVPGLCCGTDTYKYCCTGKEKLDPPPTEAEDPYVSVCFLLITLLIE